MLDELFAANAARQKEWDEGKKLDLAYYGNALAGEVGEACNVIKKLERERHGLAGSRDTIEHLGEELADSLTYLVLIAMEAGLGAAGLDKAVRKKFNAVSEARGFKTRL